MTHVTALADRRRSVRLLVATKTPLRLANALHGDLVAIDRPANLAATPPTRPRASDRVVLRAQDPTVVLAPARTVAPARVEIVERVPVVRTAHTHPSSRLSRRRSATLSWRRCHPNSCPLRSSCCAAVCPQFAQPSNCKTRMRRHKVVQRLTQQRSSASPKIF